MKYKQKWSIFSLAVILIFSILFNSCKRPIQLVKTTHFATLPSASSLEFHEDRLYIIGDDAAKIFIADADHKLLDSIPVFRSTTYRLDKDEKADLESSLLMSRNNRPYLVGYSSFSTAVRNKIVSLDLATKSISVEDTAFNIPLLAEMNIEGAAIAGTSLVLSNRANTTHRDNHLIITDTSNLENGLPLKDLKIIKIVLPPSSSVVGISGLAYCKEKDMLLFTASTEETPNAYTDGAIGESYIGYIEKFSGKTSLASIEVNTLIGLSKFLPGQAPQKIESLVVEKVKGRTLLIHLAADNDNGESSLFKIRLLISK